MDGENNGKPYEQMDDLGGKPPIFGNTQNLNPTNLLLKFRLNHSLHWFYGFIVDAEVRLDGPAPIGRPRALAMCNWREWMDANGGKDYLEIWRFQRWGLLIDQ